MQKRSVYSCFLFLLLLIFFTPAAFAQTFLKGTLTDEATKEPLVGATVLVKGTTNATTSDTLGNFSIQVKDSLPLTLQFDYMSYLKKELLVYDTETDLNVTLKPLLSFNEVVVVGYSTEERKNLIGSVSKVDPIETKNIQAGSFDAQLQGKVTGLQVSSSTGVPGEAVNVRLRGATTINGNNSPLYIIDGVFINSSSLQNVNSGGKATSPISDINPADIQSIEVLKDAEATAIYGSRGANGVIIVTTKRGDFDQKPRIEFSTTQGVAKAAKLWDLTTGPEHAQLVNEWWINTGKDDPSLNRTAANAPFIAAADGQAHPGDATKRGTPEQQQTYDRLGEAFRTARLQSYDLSVTGGSKGTRYYIGGGYNSQESILRPINFNRTSLKLNLDQKLSKHVQIGINNLFSRTGRNQGRAGDGPQGGLLQSALHTPTYLPPTNDQGQLVGRAGFDNLTLLLDNYNVKSTSLRYIGNLYGEVQILPELKFRTSFGADYDKYSESEYWNSKLLLGAGGGYATSGVTEYSSLINEQTLNYRKQLGKHTFGALLGNTLQSDVFNRTYAEGKGFPTDDFTQIATAASTSSPPLNVTETRNPPQNWSKYNLASFFGKVDYHYNDRYYVNFTVRADGSSRFGSANRWGYFPAVGVAWRIKEEPFLKNVKAVSDLKLRASYGILGNQNGINNFASPGLWSGGNGYQSSPGFAKTQVANPNLKWERTSQLNVGADIGFFANRISLEVNVYQKYTKDGLLQVALPGTTGYQYQWQNAAEISNKGFEIGLNTINIQTNSFTWTTNFNVSRNINNIEKLSVPLGYGSRNMIIQQQGHPLYSFWIYKQLYVDPATGNAIYQHADGTTGPTVTGADRIIEGSIWPKFFGGFSNNLTYKSFDLNLLFSYSYGNKVYNHNRFFGEGGGSRDAARIILAGNVDRWQQPGDITDVPRPGGQYNYIDGQGRFLEDGSFLRLRALTLGYTLPKAFSRAIRIETFRFYVTGTNLWLLTRYTGPDPESAANSDANQQGIDLGTPPQPRSIQIGLNITL